MCVCVCVCVCMCVCVCVRERERERTGVLLIQGLKVKLHVVQGERWKVGLYATLTGGAACGN